MQYPWAMCHHYVWCYCPLDVQECSHMAPWSLPVCEINIFNFCFGSVQLNWIYPIVSALWLIVCIFVAMIVCVKIYQLFSVGTRLMWRIGKSRPSRSHSTGRRICSTMRFLPRATTISKNLSCTLPGNLLGKITPIFKAYCQQ